MADAPLDLGDPKSVGQLAKDAKSWDLRRREVLNVLMNSQDGRKWVYDDLALCGCYKTPFVKDPYQTAFNAGEQNVGLRRLADIESANPQLYLLMLKENSNG